MAEIDGGDWGRRWTVRIGWEGFAIGEEAAMDDRTVLGGSAMAVEEVVFFLGRT